MPTATIPGPFTRLAPPQNHSETLSPAPLWGRNCVFYQTNPANSNKTQGKRHFYPSQTPPVSTPKSPHSPPFTPRFTPFSNPQTSPSAYPATTHPIDWRGVFLPPTPVNRAAAPSLRSLQLLDLINVDR